MWMPTLMMIFHVEIGNKDERTVKKLLNTLYVTSANRYLSLDGENVVISEKEQVMGRIPLHNLEAIVTFGYTGASPALMGACAQRGIGLTFLSGNGRFLARVSGEVYGNVMLRKEQYRRSESPEQSIKIARNCEVNAMLSFAYTLLTSMCAGALETVGLDPYVGFFHTDRPGRKSLALDMVEELRGVMGDRFVLTLINKKIVSKKGFMRKENGAVIMDDGTRKTFLGAWQSKKQETITHPFLKEKVEWGMLPYVQAMLLARYLRGDLDEYPPFFWK